jgi:hypothetical protein
MRNLSNLKTTYRLPDDPGSKTDVLSRSRIFVFRGYTKIALWLALSGAIVAAVVYASTKLIGVLFFGGRPRNSPALTLDDVDNPEDDDYGESVVKAAAGSKTPSGHAIRYNIRRIRALGRRDPSDALDSRKDRDPPPKSEDDP